MIQKFFLRINENLPPLKSSFCWFTPLGELVRQNKKNFIDIFSFAILFTVTLFSCKPKENTTTTATFDETKETAAILSVIKNETKSFFDGNYEGWIGNWSHQDYAMQAWNNSDGTADAAVGWTTINAQGKNWIDTYYKGGKNIIHPDFKTTKPNIKFFGNTAAYLIWKQYNADKDKKYYRISTEIRLMEKETDGWKIVNVSAFWDTEKMVAVDSLPLNLIQK